MDYFKWYFENEFITSMKNLPLVSTGSREVPCKKKKNAQKNAIKDFVHFMQNVRVHIWTIKKL